MLVVERGIEVDTFPFRSEVKMLLEERGSVNRYVLPELSRNSPLWLRRSLLCNDGKRLRLSMGIFVPLAFSGIGIELHPVDE